MKKYNTQYIEKHTARKILRQRETFSFDGKKACVICHGRGFYEPQLDNIICAQCHPSLESQIPNVLHFYLL